MCKAGESKVHEEYSLSSKEVKFIEISLAEMRLIDRGNFGRGD